MKRHAPVNTVARDWRVRETAVDIWPRIAEVLALSRKRLGLTQAEVAEKAEVGTRTVQRLESGQDSVQVSTLRRVGRHVLQEAELDSVIALAAGRFQDADHDETIEQVRNDLRDGYVDRAALPLMKLEVAAACGSLPAARVADVYLLCSKWAEESNRLWIARRYANAALSAAVESDQLGVVVASRLQQALVIARSYEDAASLEIVQSVDQETARDRHQRLMRDVDECVFSYWSGQIPPPGSLDRAAAEIARDPRRWATELAFLTQGLDAALLGIDPYPPWLPGRYAGPLNEGHHVLDELHRLRELTFPTSSPYANILDLLNQGNEAIANARPRKEVVRLFDQGIRLAREVGARRLASIFEWRLQAGPSPTSTLHRN